MARAVEHLSYDRKGGEGLGTPQEGQRRCGDTTGRAGVLWGHHKKGYFLFVAMTEPFLCPSASLILNSYQGWQVGSSLSSLL